MAQPAVGEALPAMRAPAWGARRAQDTSRIGSVRMPVGAAGLP
jgi:hypothetical protein